MIIITSWQCISPEMTGKCVKKSCISNVVDGTDGDDMLWDDSEEEGNVSSECEEDEEGDSDIDW